MNRSNGQVALPSVWDMGAIIMRGVKAYAKQHKIISGSYIVGVIFLVLIGSGTKLTLDQRQNYNKIMNTIDLQVEFEASNYYAQTYNSYRASKGWFTCDHLCKRNKMRMENAQMTLDKVRAEGYARMSDAKQVAGMFSEVGVTEVKDSFWGYFSAGKQFAKRQSMWDAMFMGIRSVGRDESMIEYTLRLLLQVLINFSMGLIGAFVVFVFGLWSIVRSYQTNPLTAVAFFVGASCAAFAFVSTYLFVLYGAAASSVYGMAKVLQNNARIDVGARRQRMHNRAHYY